jgi:hypothetical protein
MSGPRLALSIGRRVLSSGRSHRSLYLIASAIILIVPAITTGTAHAASTRAEYVTQVDQICSQSPRNSGRLGPKLKTLFGPKAASPLLLPGSSEPTKKQIHRSLNRFINRIARILATFNRTFSSTTEQIALVPPAPGDEAAVAQWIAGLRQYAIYTAESLRALRHHKPGAALAFQGQAIDALNAGGAAVQGFAITVCTTSLPPPPRPA